MSFYRKYRPAVLSEIDNDMVRQQLTSFLSKDKKDLPHAYLFTGPKGAGKTTAARLVAKIFNCEKPDKSGSPCGTCEACKMIAQARHLDVLELDAASNRGIDEIRALRDTIALTPSFAPYKIYIIDEVHMLTTEAFNALLKTLEEPPPHAVFVLATTDVQKIPATIISRCIHVSFSRADQKALLTALKRIVKDEKISIDDDALALIADNSDGAYRDAVKFLEQVSFHKGKITQSIVRDLFSVSEEKTISGFLVALGTRDRKEALGIIAELVKNGRDIKTFLVDTLHILESILVGSVMGKPTDVLSEQDVRELIPRLTRAYADLRISPIPQLPLELAVVEFCGEQESAPVPVSRDGSLSLEQLTEHWQDFIAAANPFNHSVAGFLRSARPKAVKNGIVTIEAFYPFHQEKLAEVKVTQLLETVLKKLFGEKVKVEIVLGKK